MKMKSFFKREDIEQKKEQRVISAQKREEVAQKRYGEIPSKRKSPFALVSSFVRSGWDVITFVILLLLYLTFKLVLRVHLPANTTFENLQNHVLNAYTKGIIFFDKKNSGSIKRIDLIDLAMKNMRMKKTRSLITIGGMAIGIGTIVFLVSLGYGLQQVVVSRVARLEELKQVDITSQAGGRVKITDKTIADFQNFPQSEYVLPLIAVVGRVNYQNSISDVAVYGVTTEYLEQSAIKTVNGSLFKSNELSRDLQNIPVTEEVAGATVDDSMQNHEIGDTIQDVSYAIYPGAWVRVRKSPEVNAEILGYTKRGETDPVGEEVWGETYETTETEEKAKFGRWIKAESLPLWKEEVCESTSGDCENGTHMVLRNSEGTQIQKSGYFAKLSVNTSQTHGEKTAVVLGETTTEAEEDKTTIAALQAGLGDGLDFVEIASESAVSQTQQVKKVDISKSAKKEAVVNYAMLKIMGVAPNEAVGKTFISSFVVVGDLLSDATQRVESVPTEYKIVGVIPDDKTPVFYVPFMDLRSLGIVNYSQVKLGVKNQADLVKVRQQVEAMGYGTRSVADTVNQINNLFATARTMLALLGMVALGVAALGMFNTLTVSLLERTHEVGLMKALGMRSFEVKELFLTESMIMGFFGGVLGITFGFIAGKLIGLVLSFFAILQGVGYIDIAYIPFEFVAAVVILSLFVGVFTGFYPAKRATQISALDALRYE